MRPERHGRDPNPGQVGRSLGVNDSPAECAGQFLCRQDTRTVDMGLTARFAGAGEGEGTGERSGRIVEGPTRLAREGGEVVVELGRGIRSEGWTRDRRSFDEFDEGFATVSPGVVPNLVRFNAEGQESEGAAPAVVASVVSDLEGERTAALPDNVTTPRSRSFPLRRSLIS